MDTHYTFSDFVANYISHKLTPAKFTKRKFEKYVLPTAYGFENIYFITFKTHNDIHQLIIKTPFSGRLKSIQFNTEQ